VASSFCNGLFGSCGVRGVVGETITEDVVRRLSQAFARHLGPGARVCVGRDTRRSGPMLEEFLIAELVAGGIDVVRLGVVSTPATYLLTREMGFSAGVMVTASHNPPEYNGFKFCNAEGMCADQETIARNYFEPTAGPACSKGSISDVDGAAAFFAHMAGICPAPLRPLKLVVDCACGPNSRPLPAFLRAQGHEVLEYNCDPDIERCDRDPEPMPSTLGKTIEFLRSQGADAGVCFDGDNDRVVFLSREGFLGFQHANAAVCRIVLEQAACKQVVGSVETGRFVEEAVKQAGGSMVRTVVGDMNVARRVKDLGAACGIEECGHYVIPAAGYFSETVYPATLMLAHRDVNAVRQELGFIPPVHADDLRIPCAEEDKRRIMESVQAAMSGLDGTHLDIDGMRVDWEDGWLLVRPSGTSPYMKVNAEAFTKERLQQLIELGAGFVREALQ
jgi:phosphomannomutase